MSDKIYVLCAYSNSDCVDDQWEIDLIASPDFEKLIEYREQHKSDVNFAHECLNSSEKIKSVISQGRTVQKWIDLDYYHECNYEIFNLEVI